jgi:type I restriction enzyme S subunit
MTTLGEIVYASPEKTDPGKNPNVPYVGLEHIDSGSRRLCGIGKAADVRSAKSVFRADDVLYGKLRPYLNKVVRPEFDGVCSTDILVFRATEKAHPAFIEHLVSAPQFVEYAMAHAAGINLPRTSYKKLAEYPVALPPLAEQRRIVAWLDALMARSRRARALLEEVPTQLAQARQSLLASAFRGDLTADWRNANRPSETAEELLNRTRMRRSQKSPSARARKEITDLPETWVSASIDDLSVFLTSGSRDWSAYYKSDGYGVFILAQNIRPMRLELSSVQRVSPPANHRDKARSQIQEGDILITIVGAGTGQVCRVPRNLADHYVCQSVALLRPALAEMGEYLEFYFNANCGAQGQFSELMYGQGRPHLGFDQLRELSVPLPPQPEQHEIVCRLNAAFARLDAASTAHQAALIELNRLDQALLSRAFYGHLVPSSTK